VHPDIVIAALWAAWGLSWIAAALWSAQTEKRAGLGAELRYRAIQLAGLLLLAVPAHGYNGSMRLWHIG
jgi:hypothetical protein